MSKLMIIVWLWVIGLGSQLWISSIIPDHDYGPKSDVIGELNRSTNIGMTLLADSAKTCVDCHGDMIEGEVVHAPAKKDCERCHITNGVEHPLDNVKGFKLKNTVPGLCYECHDSKAEKEFVHDPSKEGKCMTCHSIHNSPNIYLVKANPVSSICYECHDLKIPKQNHVHEAVTDGECQACHNPHHADNEILLSTSKLDRLCRSCHKSIRKELKKEHIHDPFKKKDCFACHNGHSSKEAHLSDLKTKDLCLSCHEDIHNAITNGKLIHGAVNVEGTCLNCHSPHSSDEPNELIGKEIDVCLNCHYNSILTETRVVSAVGPELKPGNKIHGAIEERGCSACHKSHASEDRHLLLRSFPIENYTEATVENFGLCFDCHNKDLLELQETDSVTNFRNGNENLHYLHIKGNRGSNCKLCHDVHGAENKHLIKKNTKYGNWEMPIQYEFNDNGGSCLTGCHDKLSYQRKKIMGPIRLNNN